MHGSTRMHTLSLRSRYENSQDTESRLHFGNRDNATWFQRSALYSMELCVPDVSGTTTLAVVDSRQRWSTRYHDWCRASVSNQDIDAKGKGSVYCVVGRLLHHLYQTMPTCHGIGEEVGEDVWTWRRDKGNWFTESSSTICDHVSDMIVLFDEIILFGWVFRGFEISSETGLSYSWLGQDATASIKVATIRPWYHDSRSWVFAIDRAVVKVI